jgi:hypothetical protein
MMSIASPIEWDRPNRRVYAHVFRWRQRIHHGPVGLIGLVISLTLIATDWHDRRSWFTHGDQHESVIPLGLLSSALPEGAIVVPTADPTLP